MLQLADDVVVMRDGRVDIACAACRTERERSGARDGRASIEALFPRARTANEHRDSPRARSPRLAEPGVLEDINLRVSPGEIVGIAGLMGSGRSELARVLFGLDGHSAGSDARRRARLCLRRCRCPHRRRRGVPHRRSAARRPDDGCLGCRQHGARGVAAVLHPAPAVGFSSEDAECHDASLGERLNLKSGDVRTTPVRTLSGGNQQKVVLGAGCCASRSVFILDEPTRGVDVGAKEEIYRLLAQMADAGMAILVISSELEELIGLCDRIHRHAPRRARGGVSIDEHFDREAILRAAFGQGRRARETPRRSHKSTSSTLVSPLGADCAFLAVAAGSSLRRLLAAIPGAGKPRRDPRAIELADRGRARHELRAAAPRAWIFPSAPRCISAAVAVGLGCPDAPVWLCLVGVLVVGATFGALNASLIVRLGLPAFIVTLATIFIGRGLGLFFSSTRIVYAGRMRLRTSVERRSSGFRCRCGWPPSRLRSPGCC